MKIFKILIVLLLTILSSSCMTRLKVKVSVANRDTVITKVKNDLKYELPHKANDLKFGISDLKEVKNKYFALLNSLEKDSVYKKADLDQVRVRYNEKIGEFETSLKKYDTLYKRNEFPSALDEVHATERELLELYNDTEAFIEAIKELELNKKTDAAIKETVRTTNALVRKNSTKVSSSINEVVRLRQHLLGDPLTSFISSKRKGDKFWKGVYNETKVSTFMGNADVAVLLRKNPDNKSYKSGDYNNNFTIKGVRLDAEDVIQASFKAVNQSINLFAATQLPLALTSSEQETNFPTIPKELIDKLESIESNEAIILDKKDYLQGIRKIFLSQIINSEALTTKDTTVFKKIKEDLLQSWSSYKTKLESEKIK